MPLFGGESRDPDDAGRRTVSKRRFLYPKHELRKRCSTHSLAAGVAAANPAANAEALLTGRNHYDVVVTELAAHHSDGLELLRRVAPRGTRFIVMSGWINDGVRAKIHAVQCVYRVFTKPVGCEELIEVIFDAAAIQRDPTLKEPALQNAVGCTQ
jgi:CheY-like chemotaxis protein